jgi:hypothetical protein
MLRYARGPRSSPSRASRASQRVARRDLARIPLPPPPVTPFVRDRIPPNLPTAGGPLAQFGHDSRSRLERTVLRAQRSAPTKQPPAIHKGR